MLRFEQFLLGPGDDALSDGKREESEVARSELLCGIAAVHDGKASVDFVVGDTREQRLKRIVSACRRAPCRALTLLRAIATTWRR